jgi:hypothetical protein
VSASLRPFTFEPATRTDKPLGCGAPLDLERLIRISTTRRTP